MPKRIPAAVLTALIAAALAATAPSLAQQTAQPGAGAPARVEPGADRDLEPLATDAVRFFYEYDPDEDIDEIPLVINELATIGWFRDRENFAAIVGFLAATFRNNPDKIMPLCDDMINLFEGYQLYLAYAVWVANIPEGPEAIGRLYQRMGETTRLTAIASFDDIEPWNLFTTAEMEAWQLEVLWGWYYATRDEACLDRVAEFLADERATFNLAIEASTSLSYHAAVDDAVRQWIESTIEASEGDILAADLENCLEEADYVAKNRATLNVSLFGVIRP